MRSDISNYKVDHEIVVTLCSFLFLLIILTNLLVNCIRTSLYCYPIVSNACITIRSDSCYCYTVNILQNAACSIDLFFAYCCTSANTTEHANT